MKTLKIMAVALAAFLSACSNDDATSPKNELEGLVMINEIDSETHVVELYSSGPLTEGYNEISLRIVEKSTGDFVSDAEVSWLPVMHMASMSHSCPVSALSRKPGTQSLYSGFAIFQMAQNDMEFWTLDINVTTGSSSFSVSDAIEVIDSGKRRVNSFTGTDGSKYVVAMVSPENPKVALNDMTAAIFKLGSTMQYAKADGYTLKIDPRMTSMGNHGSPNNADLVQGADGFYHGTLSLTMTGLWRINLQLQNASGEVVKGEPVTGDNLQSSLFFEVEF